MCRDSQSSKIVNPPARKFGTRFPLLSGEMLFMDAYIYGRGRWRIQ